MMPPPPSSTLIPYTTLFRSRPIVERGWAVLLVDTPGRGSSIYLKGIRTRPDYEVPGKACVDYLTTRSEVDSNRITLLGIDRKSTRLNSSHLGISYAVFCLKK